MTSHARRAEPAFPATTLRHDGRERAQDPPRQGRCRREQNRGAHQLKEAELTGLHSQQKRSRSIKLRF